MFSVKIGRLSTTVTYFCRAESIGNSWTKFPDQYGPNTEETKDAASDAEKHFKVNTVVYNHGELYLDKQEL